MKKLLVVCLILSALCLIIVGCSSSTTTSSAAIEPSASNVATAAPAATATSPAISKPAAAIPSGAASTPSVTSSASATTPAVKPASQTGAKYGGTLRDIEAGGPGSPIGWPQDLAGAAGVTAQISMDQLLHEDYKGNIMPALASSYDVVSDPKNASITYHLRKGVKFQDGTDFNAQGVKWNLDMIKTGVNASVTAAWKSWEVLDDYTIRVNLNNWQNFIVRNFAGLGELMCSPTAYQKNGIDWMRWNIVGTGPFVQTGFVRDVNYTATRFAGYWEQGKPYLDGITLLYVADPMTRLALFKSGGGDIMGVQPNDAFSLQQDGYPIINYPAGANALVPDSLNTDSPWSNAKVRMAAEYAIDREALSKAFGYGFNPAAYQVAPSTSPAFIPNLAGRKYDTAKAKQLLADAGFPNGFKSKIITLSTGNRDIAVAIQSYLKSVGIQVDIDFIEPARYAVVSTGTWNNALLLDQLRPFPNFNAVLSIDYGSPTTFWKSLKKPEGWQAMLDATTNSLAQDPVLMQKASQALFDDCTTIPTTYYASLYVAQPYVRDSGRGEMGSGTQFTPQNAWLSK